jgi:hypothetical protein
MRALASLKVWGMVIVVVGILSTFYPATVQARRNCGSNCTSGGSCPTCNHCYLLGQCNTEGASVFAGNCPNGCGTQLFCRAADPPTHECAWVESVCCGPVQCGC